MFTDASKKELTAIDRWLDRHLSKKGRGALDALPAELKRTVNLYALFVRNETFLMAIARRYSSLDNASDIDDLRNTAYLGFAMSVNKFKFGYFGSMKFSTVLTWYIQKAFKKLTPPTFMDVEIEHDSGEKEVMSYHDFSKRKKKIKTRNYTVVKQLLSMEEIDEDSEIPEGWGDSASLEDRVVAYLDSQRNHEKEG